MYICTRTTSLYYYCIPLVLPLFSLLLPILPLLLFVSLFFPLLLSHLSLPPSLYIPLFFPLLLSLLSLPPSLYIPLFFLLLYEQVFICHDHDTGRELAVKAVNVDHIDHAGPSHNSREMIKVQYTSTHIWLTISYQQRTVW